MGKHDATTLTNARDELMSHIVRCGALDATQKDRMEWLDETMDYMADRYPGLGELELASLEMIGRQYLKPVIPHGKEHTAVTMDRSVEAAEQRETQAA